MEETDLIFLKYIDGDHSVIERLVQDGLPINNQNSEGDSLLHLTAAEGDVSNSELLVIKGANIDLQNNYGWSPLMHAARHGHSEIVTFLIKKRAKVNAANCFGLRAVDFAAWSGNANCVNSLIDAGAVIDNNDDQNELCDLSSLMAAASQGHNLILQILLEKGSSINQASPITGLTPLMLAACNGYLQIAKTLIEWGIDVNVTSKFGQTALYFATACNHENVKAYLESLTLPNFVKTADDVIETNILNAVRNRNIDVIKSLLQQNQSLCNYSDPSVGITPLMFASMHGHNKIIELLIANGSDINAQDFKDGWTPLMYAVFHRQAETVHLLLDKGAKVDICSSNGYTALDLAVHIDSADTDIVETLLACSTTEDLIETQDYFATSPKSTIRRSYLSTEKVSSRSESPVRFKCWIGGISSHLRSRSKSSAACSPVDIPNIETSMSDVFLDISTVGKPLEGNYISISKLYAPNQRFSHVLKEQVVEAIILPPLPSQSSDASFFKNYSSRRNKNSKSFNSLKCPHLIKRYFERSIEKSKTVAEKKSNFESSQKSTLKSSSDINSCQLSLVDRSDTKDSISYGSTAKGLTDICKGSLKKYAEKFRDQEIDFETFKHLTEDDLNEIGVQSLESRNKFLEIIQKCKNS